MKLVAEVLKTPSFDENEFEKLKQEEPAGIESQRSEPQAIAFNQYRRIDFALSSKRIFVMSVHSMKTWRALKQPPSIRSASSTKSFYRSEQRVSHRGRGF